MNILHITDELTKKNYSISSLIFFLIDYIEEKKEIKHHILTTSLQKNLFKDENQILIIKKKFLFNFYNINLEIEKIVKMHDLVHIHGIWRWINFITIFHCTRLSIPFFVHTHGMLLDAALKNKNTINYLIKIFFLKIYNLISVKNINFISITSEETKSIYKYFKKATIHFIPNPIPFDVNKQNLNLNNNFVYFGRIHPIKNLILMIEAFDGANLPANWKLNIYGIRDDENYYSQLIELIKNKDNIFIKEPVFGKEKLKILSSSWANILLSKSEVLSLSVLESAALELPSLVNKDIQIDNFTKNEGVITDTAIKSISKNIKEISNWPLSLRKDKGRKLQKFISTSYSMDALSIKYFKLYDNIGQFKNILIQNTRENVLYKYFINTKFNHTSFAYIFNLLVPSLLMVCIVISGNAAVGADLALVNSFWITLTQVFSSNIRARAITNDNRDLVNRSMIFRIYICLLFFIPLLLFQDSFKFQFENHLFLIVFSGLILTQWIYELILAHHEINNRIFKFIIFNIYNVLLIFAYLYAVFSLNIEVLLYLIIANISILILLILNHLITRKIVMFDFKLFFLDNLKTLAFLSSTTVIFSSFVWKLLLYLFYPKAISSIIFAAFSIGSFPGTIFNSALGPTFIKNKIILNKLIKQIIYITFFITICSTFYSVFNLSNVIEFDIVNGKYTFYTFMVSICGSFLMTYAMYFRHLNIQLNQISQEGTFKLDSSYGILITVLLPILHFWGNVYLVSATFLFASMFALLIYGIYNRKNKLVS